MTWALLSVIASSVVSQNPYDMLPFTQEENADGSAFVWWWNARLGWWYDYCATADMPTHPQFLEVEWPQNGDISWWPVFMGFYTGNGILAIEGLPAGGLLPIDSIIAQHGAPRFFRLKAIQNGDEPGAPLNAYRLLGGRLLFVTTANWEPDWPLEQDGAHIIVLRVPNPATDSIRFVDSEFTLALRSIPTQPSLRVFSDSMVADDISSTDGAVEFDSVESESRRLVIWSSQLGDRRWVMIDAFASEAEVYVHVRCAVPLVGATQPEWYEDLVRDVNAAMRRMTLEGESLFPNFDAGLADFDRAG